MYQLLWVQLEVSKAISPTLLEVNHFEELNRGTQFPRTGGGSLVGRTIFLRNTRIKNTVSSQKRSYNIGTRDSDSPQTVKQKCGIAGTSQK